MARTGMTTLIGQLRQLTNAGTADATINTTTYYSDDHLQTELDRTQRTYRRIALRSVPTLTNGAYEYYDYLIPIEIGYAFEEAATDSGWAVKDGTGATLGTALYAVNYTARKLTFSADQHGSIHYLDARSYDLNRAAAAVWRHKAGFASANVNWQSDNHRIEAAQELQHCLRMADTFDALAGARSARFERDDEAGSPASLP
jgi:hypothetical protein